MGRDMVAAASMGHGSTWAEYDRIVGEDIHTEVLVVAGALVEVVAEGVPPVEHAEQAAKHCEHAEVVAQPCGKEKRALRPAPDLCALVLLA